MNSSLTVIILVTLSSKPFSLLRSFFFLEVAIPATLEVDDNLFFSAQRNEIPTFCTAGVEYKMDMITISL